MQTNTTTTPTTPEQEAQDFTANLAEMRTHWPQVRDLPATVKSLETQLAEATEQLTILRRQALYSGAFSSRSRLPGSVSDECAREIAARMILHYERNGRLESICSVPSECDKLLHFSRSVLGITQRAALTTGEVPLPAQYGSQLRELISEFGVARRVMSHYPITMGVAKPPRMGVRPSFRAIAMAASSKASSYKATRMKTNSAVPSLQDQVAELGASYALWWYFLEKSHATRYAPVQIHYPDFFITIANSLRASFFITAYRLFDSRGDVDSLTRLINGLDLSNPTLAVQLRGKALRVAHIIEKIKQLRNKVFGHRDKSRPPEEWFAKAALTPREMQAVVRTAQDIISTAAGPEHKSDLERRLQSYEDAVRNDAHNIMLLLQEHTE